MHKKFRDILSVVSDVGGIFGLIQIIYFGLPAFWANAIQNKITLIYSICITLFLASLLIRLVLNSRKKISETLDNAKISGAIESIERKYDGDFVDLIPSEKTLKTWLSIADKKARKWSEDAVRSYYNMYIDRHIEFRSGPKIQVFYYSKWKDEILTVYVGSLNAENLSEGGSNIINASFIELNNWRKAIVIAQKKLDSRLQGSYEVQIASHRRENMLINFTFKEGALSKREHFEFDGKKLFHRKSEKEYLV